MIIVAELFFSDGAHVPFNAGFLAIIRAAFPNERVSFFGAREHMEELKKQLGVSLAETISWIEITLPGSGLNYFGRLFYEIKTIGYLFRQVARDRQCHILFTSAGVSTLVALKLVKRLQFQRIKAQVVLHGSLSEISDRRCRRRILKFQDTKTCLTIFGNSNIQYLVLEDSIRDSVLKTLPSLAGKIETLDHPLPPNEARASTRELSIPIHFGFLGLANELKGFPLFVRVANQMSARHHGRVNFHAVGRLPEHENSPSEMTALAVKPGAERMSRKEFLKAVRPLHFIIFPNLVSRYELSPSGTLLDAIAWEKPLIARRIPIFEDMFRKHGDIGYLFNNDNEVEEIVDQIVCKVDRSRYSRQVLNIRNARACRSPESLAPSYRAICRKLDAVAEN